MLKLEAVSVSPPVGMRGVRVMKSIFREPRTAMGAGVVVAMVGGVRGFGLVVAGFVEVFEVEGMEFVARFGVRRSCGQFIQKQRSTKTQLFQIMMLL